LLDAELTIASQQFLNAIFAFLTSV